MAVCILRSMLTGVEHSADTGVIPEFTPKDGEKPSFYMSCLMKEEMFEAAFCNKCLSPNCEIRLKNASLSELDEAE